MSLMQWFKYRTPVQRAAAIVGLAVVLRIVLRPVKIIRRVKLGVFADHDFTGKGIRMIHDPPDQAAHNVRV